MVVTPRDGAPRAPRLALFTDTFAPQINGVARTLERLVAAVESRGGAVQVHTVQAPGAPADPRVRRWTSVPFWAYRELRMAAPPARAVRAALRDFAPTMIHATTPFGVGLAGRAAARALGIPLVTSYHTSFGAYLEHYGLSALDAVAWPYLRWFHNGGRRTFAPSALVAAELAAQGFRDVRVWSRGVDPSRFHPRFRSAAMREAMGAAPGDLVVAYVGRLAPEKGIHVVSAAMRAVHAASAGRIRFAVAGDGPAAERTKREAPPGTWFAGALQGERLSAFYASADMLVFPSTTETFGNVVLEAMSSGVPVIAPDSGATLELAHAESARIVRAHDPAAWAAAILALADAPAERARLAAAGLVTAAARSWEHVWDGLFAEYAAAADSRGAHSVSPAPAVNAGGSVRWVTSA